MSHIGKGYDINQTFVIETADGAAPIISGCTGVYTNEIISCSGDTYIELGTSVIRFVGDASFTGALSATTYYGDGSNLTGISFQDVYVTGGTYNTNTGIATFTNNTGGTFTISGFSTSTATSFTGGTVTGATQFTNGVSANTFSATTYLGLPIDVFTTGGTYNQTSGLATFTNNTGGTFSVSGFYTGYTLTSSEIISVLGYTPLSAYTDTFVTGGTYSNGTATFTNNTGGTFSVSGFGTGDTYWASGSTGIYSIKANNNSGLDATGSYALAQGNNTKAIGQASHAEGISSTALGDFSHAEGETTLASGYASHSEGSNTTASDLYSHAEGELTIASGNTAHAEGYLSIAGGNYSHAEGSGTTASGVGSHAEGGTSKATGLYSHAEGNTTTASGVYSHTEGWFTMASGQSAHAEGTGTSAGATNAHAEGGATTATGISSHSEGSNTRATGISAHAEGTSTSASGNYSHSEGSGTTASGVASHSEGSGTTASGIASHAGGFNSVASGNTSFVHGHNAYASGNFVTVFGQGVSGTTDNTVFVPRLNVKFLSGGTSVSNVGIDINGFLVTGSGSSGTDIYTTGGTYNNSTGTATFTNNSGGTFNVNGFYTGDTTQYVKITGDTMTGGLFSPSFTGDSFTFSTGATVTGQVGRLKWNDTDGTLDLGLKGGAVTLQIGQEQVARVVNKTSIDLLESAYDVVRITGATGQRLSVALAQANNATNSNTTFAVVTETILKNQEGFVTTFGRVNEINTTGSLQGETWVDGDTLYLSPTSAGKLTNVKPTAPNHSVIVGFVEYAHAIHGKIFVSVNNCYELGDLHNVRLSGLSNNDVLTYNSASQIWVNRPASFDVFVTGGTVTNNIATFTNNTGGTFNLISFVNGNTYWTSGSTGSYSIKTNNDSTTDAQGDYSVAEGYNNTAIGFYSHAEGSRNTAIGEASHVEGDNNTAEGTNSHAEGAQSIAQGAYSHAEGQLNIAVGASTHVEGYSSTALGDFSHAEGKGTTSEGAQSHSQGQATVAFGPYSHAGGFTTTATGEASFVHGYNSIVNGNYSAVFGHNITGSTDNTVFAPRFNVRYLSGGTSVTNVGIDANGFLVSGTTGGSSGTEVFVTGGTKTGSNVVFTNNTGGTFTVTGFTDIWTTGSTKSGTIATFTNNTGGTFTLTGLTDTFTTGGTKTGSNVVFTNNTGGTFTVTGFTDIWTTGGTYSNGTATFTNNTGGTFSVSGFSTSTATSFTGGTVTGATFFSGGASATTFSATTYLGLPLDIRITGGTFSSGGTITLTNNSGGTVPITGITSFSALSADTLYLLTQPTTNNANTKLLSYNTTTKKIEASDTNVTIPYGIIYAFSVSNYLT
jgi:hypothetical protein